MAARVVGGSGAALRRRERRLRAFHRHEALSVRLALASALHHSTQRVEELREEEEHVKIVGPWAQKAPPPGTRPAPLAEVAEPQWEAVTVGYVAAPGPLLSTPTLMDSVVEEVDRRAVKFLLQAELKQRKKEEVKERRRQREAAAYEARMQELERNVDWNEQLAPEESYAWRMWAGHLPDRKRKKKKRRRKKLPKASSLTFLLGRPCSSHSEFWTSFLRSWSLLLLFGVWMVPEVFVFFVAFCAVLSLSVSRHYGHRDGHAGHCGVRVASQLAYGSSFEPQGLPVAHDVHVRVFNLPAMLGAIRAACLRLLRDPRLASRWTSCSSVQRARHLRGDADFVVPVCFGTNDGHHYGLWRLRSTFP